MVPEIARALLYTYCRVPTWCTTWRLQQGATQLEQLQIGTNAIRDIVDDPYKLCSTKYGGWYWSKTICKARHTQLQLDALDINGGMLQSACHGDAC